MQKLKVRTNQSKIAKNHRVRTNKISKQKPAGHHQHGLKFHRVFSNPRISPFNQVEWERRDVAITDDNGKAIFQQDDVEVPKNWSTLATTIAVSKYFYGDSAHGTDPYNRGRENSVRQLIHRVTRTITDWGINPPFS